MIFKDIKISGWRSFSHEYPIKTPNLGHVNLLIGSNNVGKSNLGRFLVKLRDHLQNFRDADPWNESRLQNKIDIKKWADPLTIIFPINEIDCWLRNTKSFDITAEMSIYMNVLNMP